MGNKEHFRTLVESPLGSSTDPLFSCFRCYVQRKTALIPQTSNLFTTLHHRSETQCLCYEYIQQSCCHSASSSSKRSILDIQIPLQAVSISHTASILTMAPLSAPAPAPSLPPLSFGVEFEFAFAYALPGKPIPRHHLDGSDGLPAPFRGHYQIKEPTYRQDVATKPQLEVFDLINKALHDGGLASFHGPIPAEQMTATTDYGKNVRWNVKGDPTIKAPEGEDEYTYHWVDVEVVSPVLMFPADLWQIQRACEILNQFRISCNITTGFHVHVGLPFPPGFVLDTTLPWHLNGVPKFDFYHLQQIVAFCYIFAPQIDNLHPPSRENNDWARNMRAAVAIALEEMDGHDFDPKKKWDCLDAIATCTTEKQLTDVAGHADGGCLPMVSLSDYIHGLFNRRTIEFRQHCGTTDWGRIEAWIRLTVGITDYCRYVGAQEFTDLVYGQADCEDNGKKRMNTKQVLELIQDPAVVSFYEDRLARWNWREQEAPGVGRPRALSNEHVTDSDDESEVEETVQPQTAQTARTAQGYAHQADDDEELDDACHYTDGSPMSSDDEDEEDRWLPFPYNSH